MAIAEGGAETDEQRLRPPSLLLMLAEMRALFELNSSLLLSPLLLLPLLLSPALLLPLLLSPLLSLPLLPLLTD